MLWGDSQHHSPGPTRPSKPLHPQPHLSQTLTISECSAHLLLWCRWVPELRSPLCTAERCFRFSKTHRTEKARLFSFQKNSREKMQHPQQLPKRSVSFALPHRWTTLQAKVSVGSWHPGVAPWSIFYITLCMLIRFSHIQLFVILWTIAHQAPLAMGLSRQEYWSGLPCPPPGDLPDAGTEPLSRLLHWQVGSSPRAPLSPWTS